MPLGSNTPSERTPHSRRPAVRYGLVALALAVLVVLPAVLSGQASFFARYPGLEAHYEPWSTSTHLEAGCSGCHVRPTLPAQVLYRVRMVGVFYASLVSRSTVPSVFDTPTNEACLDCHSDLRSVSPAGDLQIPHRAHVSVLNMRCVECHDYLVHELSPAGTHTPPMIGCLTCHDGDRAKDACTACHTAKAAPETHSSPEWLIVHGDHADDPECVDCHQWRDDWCVDCHSERPSSHGTDWRANHGARVAVHRGCEACHRGEFCVRCHGEVPSLNLDPALKVVE